MGMVETEWAQYVAQKLNAELPNYRVEAGKKLINANEVVQYDEGQPLSKDMPYETDVLVYESRGNDSWTPRLVIETTINNVTTEEAIAYSQKAQVYKSVHPHLRYGVFIGNRKKHSLPGRMFRHGAHFDFMLYWQAYKPRGYEWDTFIGIIKKEIYASRQLEEMLFNSRTKSGGKYFAIHKQLIATPVNN